MRTFFGGLAGAALFAVACAHAQTPVTVLHSAVIPANSTETVVSVDCPAGMSALSGGIIPGNVFDSEVAASGPLFGTTRVLAMPASSGAVATGWYGIIHSFSNATMPVTVEATCVALSGMTSVVATTAVSAATSGSAPNFGGVLPGCPAGFVATGGGGDTSDHFLMKISSSAPLLSASLPGGYPAYNHPDGVYGAPTGWNVFARNQRTSTGTLVGAAICAPQIVSFVTALHNFSVPPTTLPVGASGTATCPLGKIAIGGGIDMANVLTGVSVYSIASVADTSPPARAARADGTYPVSNAWMASFYSYLTGGFAAATVAICVDAPRAVATLFYNTGLNHYFMTADDAEVDAIAHGAAGPGWTQLPEKFTVLERGPAATGSGDVCRFYGTPGKGPNSHFYTIEPAECAAVKLDPGWSFEAIAFRALKPTSPGVCPAGTLNVYRVYNHRFAFNDSNHRYTTSLANYNAMIAAGWDPEGVVFCALATD